MSDLLWSDPEDHIEWEPSPRGCGWLFGPNPVKNFLYENNMRLVARSHQLVNSGYSYIFDSTLVTVWSAPNYCNRCGNMAAILQVDEELNITEEIFFASKPRPRDKEEEAKIEMNYFL